MSKPVDVFSILELVARLAQATDDRDVDAYADCLASQVNGGAESRSYAIASIGRVSEMAWTHHKLCNPVVSVSGDSASARIDVVIDMARTGPEGDFRHATMGGRYALGFSRIDGRWRIVRRELHRRYILGDGDLLRD